MSLFRKSIKTIEIGINNSVVYKNNFILGFMSSIVSLIIQMVFWPVYYNSGANMNYVSIEAVSIAGYSLREMMTYSLVIYFIQRILSMMNISGVIKSDIMNGGLNIHLIRPTKYLWTKWLELVSNQLLNLLLSIFLIGVVFIFFNSFFIYPQNTFQIATVLVFLILACVLSFLINSLVGILSFWLLETQSLGILINMTISMLSGSLFPIDLINEHLSLIIKYLPFSYMAFFPSQVFLGKVGINEIISNLLVCFSWIIGFIFIVYSLWKKGIRKYSAFGG